MPEDTGNLVPRGPATWPPNQTWPQAVHAGVAQLKDVIARWGLLTEPGGRPILVAVSGGADSLALAVLAAETQRVTGMQFGAAVFDHQLQAVTATVAQRTAELCSRLGRPVVQET